MTNPTTVLVVEDEPLVSMALIDDLQEQSYTVLEAANDAQAMQLLENRSDIRLIITDVYMPGSMDGLMLAAAVANRWPPFRIIVVSGRRTVGVTGTLMAACFTPGRIEQTPSSPLCGKC